MHAHFYSRLDIQIVQKYKSKEIMKFNSNTADTNRIQTSKLKIPEWSKIRWIYYFKRDYLWNSDSSTSKVGVSSLEEIHTWMIITHVTRILLEVQVEKEISIEADIQTPVIAAKLYLYNIKHSSIS